MDPEKKIRIKRLQQNLLAIRKFAGWTTENLGEQIGVTKQTISNLENGKTEMTLTQYIAIRAVLDDEIRSNPENETLRAAVNVLLDDEELSEEEQLEIQEKTRFIANAMTGGAKRETGMKMALEIFGAAAGIAVGVATRNPFMGTHTWLTIMRSGSDKDDVVARALKGKKK